ncbi:MULTISPECIES: hypothetical protein [Nostocales]|uniref:hypothetical protein n=1 Tax=Nostocales TaxID=1161 RepID=UPI0016855BE9|nr:MULTISPECIES: hypothetical protein [Nostocales]MBD2477390.1 hypothetical protein [Anabaena sp. FACHB-83]
MAEIYKVNSAEFSTQRRLSGLSVIYGYWAACVLAVKFWQFSWRWHNANRYTNIVWFDGFMCR